MSDDHTRPLEVRPRKPKWISERVRDALQEAVDRGEFSNLPGEGKPLDLTRDDNPFVPEDLKLGYRILSNAGIGVPWIEDRKEIDRRRTVIDRETTLHEARIQASRRNLARMPAFLRANRTEKLLKEHAAFIDYFTRTATSLNRRIDLYNLSVPATPFQVNRIDLNRVLTRFEALLGTVTPESPDHSNRNW